MLTVDFDRLGLQPGERMLDMGCGGGRHAFEAIRRGATVVAFDYSEGELKDVRGVIGAMGVAGEIPAGTEWGTVNGDALNLPFADGSFDVIVASEVLEHLWATEWAMSELVRVLRPGGRIAVTVPREYPERLCWILDTNYHDVPGGHVRIFKRKDLQARLTRAGLVLNGHDHQHGLHSTYWWIRCAGGVNNPDRFFARHYHELLVKQITDNPAWLASIDRVLNPLIGKSLIVYGERPVGVR
jgi:SAM-dependent methyltransferase